jgi:hypothetical protein
MALPNLSSKYLTSQYRFIFRHSNCFDNRNASLESSPDRTAATTKPLKGDDRT